VQETAPQGDVESESTSPRDTAPSPSSRDGDRNGAPGAWARATRAAELVLLVSAVVALLSSLVLWRVGKAQLHLVTWVRTTSVVYPAPATGDLTLPLDYDQEPATSVTVLDLNISNFGKQVIGGADTTWRLSLSVPMASHLVALDAPRARPRALVVRRVASADPDAVVLEIGAFEPRAEINLRVAAINPTPREFPDVKAESSLTGLPVEVTTSSPTSRFGERLFLPLSALYLLVLSVVASLEWRRDRALGRVERNPVRELVSRAALVLVLSAIVGALTAMGLGLLVSWFI
jgi:hypothetical protein